MKILIYINILLYVFTANAEYRVYQYLIKEDNLKPVSINSNLSPTSYISYHGSTLNFKIDLLRTWMCPGNTSHFKEYCKSPYNNAEIIKSLIGSN